MNGFLCQSCEIGALLVNSRPFERLGKVTGPQGLRGSSLVTNY